MESTISSKGQVTVPKAVRDRLHLRTGDRVTFLIDDEGAARVVPITASVTALKGMVPKPRRPLMLEEMDAAILRAAARRSCTPSRKVVPILPII